MQPMKNTSCILHSKRQNITWKHAADKNMNCVQQHKKFEKHVAEHEPHATQDTTQLTWT